MNGYIPEGGVWTAEERLEAETADWPVEFAEEWRRADATVAALVAALEDSTALLKDHVEWHQAHWKDAKTTAQNCTLHMAQARAQVDKARALLDAVKGGGK